MNSIEIIANSGKFKKVEDLIHDLDLIIDLLKQDIEKICKVKGLHFSDFEATFKAALNQTKFTLLKKNLSGVKRFYSCKNLKDALKWLQNRTINNMLNSNNIKHKFAFKPPIYCDVEDYNISKTYDIDKEIEIENLKKLPKEILIKGLKRVWEEGKYDINFDLKDFKQLCTNCNIKITDILDNKELKAPKIGVRKLKNGLKETFLVL